MVRPKPAHIRHRISPHRLPMLELDRDTKRISHQRSPKPAEYPFAVHIKMDSRADNKAAGILSRLPLRAIIPPTIAAFVSQSPPTLIVLPRAVTKFLR